MGTDPGLRALNALADCQARAGLEAEAQRTVEASLTASAGRADGDPYRTYALAIRERLGGDGR